MRIRRIPFAFRRIQNRAQNEVTTAKAGVKYASLEPEGCTFVRVTDRKIDSLIARRDADRHGRVCVSGGPKNEAAQHRRNFFENNDGGIPRKTPELAHRRAKRQPECAEDRPPYEGNAGIPRGNPRLSAARADQPRTGEGGAGGMRYAGSRGPTCRGGRDNARASGCCSRR